MVNLSLQVAAVVIIVVLSACVVSCQRHHRRFMAVPTQLLLEHAEDTLPRPFSVADLTPLPAADRTDGVARARDVAEPSGIPRDVSAQVVFDTTTGHAGAEADVVVVMKRSGDTVAMAIASQPPAAGQPATPEQVDTARRRAPLAARMLARRGNWAAGRGTCPEESWPTVPGYDAAPPLLSEAARTAPLGGLL